MNHVSCFDAARRSWTGMLRILFLFAVGSVIVGCQAGNSEKPTVAVDKPKQAPINPAVLDHIDHSIQAGKLDEANSLLEQILVMDSEHRRVRLLVAELQLAMGERQSAIHMFSELTGTPELAARAHQGMGIAYLLEGERDRAFEALTKSLEIDPTNWRAWNGLGFYHDSLGQWDQANRSYTKALSLNADSAIVFSNRGYSRILSGDVDGAMPDLIKAVELDPRLEVARINLRIALAWKGRYREALLGVKERELGTVFNNVGFVALMRGDRGSAETYFHEAMKSDATFNETAWRNLDYLKNLNAMDRNPSRNR